MRWPKSNLPCSESAFWIGLSLYAVIGGCVMPRGWSEVELAFACYATAYLVSVAWAVFDNLTSCTDNCTLLARR